MTVSIITICFNSEAAIKKTIESVLNQTYTDIEYIIIDGASKDKTVEIAESYKDAFAEKGIDYKIFSEPDKGIYDAMNKGIAKATGELVGLINSGDFYEPQMIETAVKAFEEKPYDIFYGDINLIKDNGQIIVKKSKYDKLPTSRHWNHPTMVVRKAYYDEIGTYKCEGIHDDFEFFLRARKKNARITIKNVTLANFMTGGASNKKSFKQCKKRCKDRYKAYRDNGYGIWSWFECVGIEIAKFIIS
ncbi:Glycosyltransferase involved in cell wall bisynthesis [Lachnospiraceae bacterium G41]|nr:Glycosyltransferase involved in cell wall bisynthesis [Lachnospiraceae bacterium G41]